MSYRSDTIHGDNLANTNSVHLTRRDSPIFETQDMVGVAVATLMTLGPLCAYAFGL